MRTDMPLAKKNYWKVDESRITEKMVRRHFKGILEQSPVLSSTVKIENRPVELCVTDSPTPAAHHAQKKHEMKFSSSFSIESLLRRNCPSHLGPRHAPPSVVCSASVKAEQLPWREERAVGLKRNLSWDSPPVQAHRVPRTADSYCIYTTGGDIDRGFHAYGAQPTKRLCVEPNIRSMAEYTKSSFAQHFMFGTHTHTRYAQYPTSEYDYDVQHLRLWRSNLLLSTVSNVRFILYCIFIVIKCFWKTLNVWYLTVLMSDSKGRPINAIWKFLCL